MSIVFIITFLYFAYNIIKNDGDKRFAWFVCSMLLFSSSIIVLSKPQVTTHRLFILSFICSIIYHKEYKGLRFPIRIPFIIYFIGVLFIGLDAPFLTPFYKIYKPVMLFLSTYFLFVLGYINGRQCNIRNKYVISTLYFITIYGLFMFVTHTMPIGDLWKSVFNIGVLEQYYFGGRIRIGSTWSHPIAYGMICTSFFILLFQWWKEKKIQVLLALLFVNVAICGSRTAIVTLVISIVIYYIRRYKIRRLALYSLLGVSLFSITYTCIPFVQSTTDSIIGTVTGDTKVEGSSLDMRDIQLTASLLLFDQSPIWGNGFDYLQEVMGFGTDNWIGDHALYGLESYMYIVLIERGIIGCTIEVLMLASLLYLFLRKKPQKKTNLSYNACALALTLGFVFFILSTGTLDTFPLVMFIIGTCMKKSEFNYGYKKISNHHSCI